MTNKPIVKYFARGIGQEIFRALQADKRLKVEIAGRSEQQLDFGRNVCAWVRYNGDYFSVGRPDVKGFLHELSRTLHMDLSEYTPRNDNV
jgi:hypothetical protein